jgi:hypothetical protein
MDDDVEVCEVCARLLKFEAESEGWTCKECGRLVCPLCIDPATERCYQCEGAVEDSGAGLA